MRGKAIAGWTAANTIVLIAALFPVLWILSLSLKKPADVIGTVRQTRAATRFDPVAEGRRGLAEGDLSRARRAGGRDVDRSNLTW